MEKTKAQEMAIRSRKDKEEKSGEWDKEGGKGKKMPEGYRSKEDKEEKHQKISGDGDKKVGKCKHCGK